jgi:hypothetical protein
MLSTDVKLRIALEYAWTLVETQDSLIGDLKLRNVVAGEKEEL